MDRVFDYIPILLWSQHYGLLAIIGLGLLLYYMQKVYYRTISKTVETITLYGSGLLVPVLLCAIFWWVYAICTDNYTIGTIAEREAVSNPMVVVDKKEHDLYVDYKLSCGRVNGLYARIYKFDEYYDDNLYCVKMDNKTSTYLSKVVRIKIDKAITSYNLYGKDN